MIQSPFEAIVIGSGATGGVAALTLASQGIRVLVIEAGPELTAEKAFGSEPLNTIKRINGLISGEKRLQCQHPGYWKANPSLYSNEKSNPYTFPKERPFLWTQGRQVGGRSLTWGGITLRLSDFEFKASTRDGYGPNWPISYSELKDHYSFLEKLFKVHGSRDNLEQLPDGEFLKPLSFTESEEEFSGKIKKKFNYPLIHSRGFAPHESSKSSYWPSSSSPGSSLKLALDTGKVDILSNQMAERLIMNKEQTKATGILIVDQNNGARNVLESKLIVLCLSTIQTIRLLLSSEEESQSNGLIDPSKNLGCYLMDHISTCHFFAWPKKTIASKQAAGIETDKLSGAGSFFIPFGSNHSSSKKPEFIRGYGIWGAIDRFEPPQCLKRIRNTATGFLIGHGEVLPYKDNRVTLSKTLDKWGVPVPHIDCHWRENEINMFSHMNQTIKKMVNETGGLIRPLSELIKMPLVEPIINKAVALQETPPPPGYYIHEVGGAAMGESENQSVLDPFNRLWRCQNVLVVDGSCWPTSAWQSPTLTMMAITRRACLAAVRNQKE